MPVTGMICMTPTALVEETARWYQPDSSQPIARASLGSTPWRVRWSGSGRRSRPGWGRTSRPAWPCSRRPPWPGRRGRRDRGRGRLGRGLDGRLRRGVGLGAHNRAGDGDALADVDVARGRDPAGGEQLREADPVALGDPDIVSPDRTTWTRGVLVAAGFFCALVENFAGALPGLTTVSGLPADGAVVTEPGTGSSSF